MPKMLFQRESYINSLHLHTRPRVDTDKIILKTVEKAGRSELSLITKAQMSLLTGLLQLKQEKGDF